MKRSWFAVCLFACLLVGAAGAQATLTVSAPPDRLALPGDYVTLVFRVTSSVSRTATLEIASEHGYTLLKPPDTLALQAGVTGMVPVTVAIPTDAPALTVDRVMVAATVGAQRVESGTHVTVGEKRGLSVEAPSQVLLSQRAIPFTLVNEGNVPETASLQVTHGGKPFTTRHVDLAPGARVTSIVPISEAGGYRASVLADGKVVGQAYVDVRLAGVPPPPPITLHTDVSGSLDTYGWAFGVNLAGQLSDYVSARASVRADALPYSFVDLSTEHWRANAGAIVTAPLDLSLPSELGLSGEYITQGWRVGATTTWVADDKFAGYAFGGYRDERTTIGAAMGVHAGAPLVALHAFRDQQSSSWQVDGSVLSNAVSASVKASRIDDVTQGTVSIGLSADQIFKKDGNIEFSAAYHDATAGLYGSVTAPVGSSAAWFAVGGLSADVPSSLPGSLTLNVQAGSNRSLANLRYASVLTGGWTMSGQLGIVGDANGFGFQTSTNWIANVGKKQIFGADGTLTYYPSGGDFSGRVSGRYATSFGPATISLSGAWDIGQATIGLGSALQWTAPGWGARMTAGAGYDVPTATMIGSLGISADWAFDVTVPDALVRLAGGRRQGVLAGRLHADGHGIANVRVLVGPYVLTTDSDGRFTAQLDPGPVRVRVDLASLPIEYRLTGPPQRSFQVSAHTTTRADFAAVETAGLRVQVLEDSDGDGTPDVPARSVDATVLVSVGNGPQRVLEASADGSFTARGLAAGQATLVVGDLPLGYAIEGTTPRSLTLRAGTVRQITVLVSPPTTAAPVFTARRLRIRSVSVQADHLPPGAAPLVTVHVDGDPTDVSVSTDGTVDHLSKDDGTWTGRIPIPIAADPGPFKYMVTAKGHGEEAHRDGLLVVDPNEPSVETSVDRAPRPGERFTVALTVYLEATKVKVQSPFGSEVVASKVSLGHWTADVSVPSDASAGPYEAHYTVTTSDGRTLKGSLRFRVLEASGS